MAEAWARGTRPRYRASPVASYRHDPLALLFTTLGRALTAFAPKKVFGVDFSGARLAGKTAFLATLELGERPRFTSLASLGERAGSDERDVVMPWLVAAIRAERDLLVGIDAPFSLPSALEKGATYAEELAYVATFPDAQTLGRTLAEEARARFGKPHVRRRTDALARTPFDSYHYRIVHQTFVVMRDVCRPLLHDARTALLPFAYGRLPGAHRVVLETCPSSTLKRLGLPFRGYKDPGKASPSPEKVAVRRGILAAIEARARVPRALAERAMQDPGGDALDAMLAALGALEGFTREDHRALAEDASLVREGWVYA